MRLLGRRAECEALDGVLTDALAGRSRVAVLRGEAGAGKSVLLGYLSERVAGWHVATAVGVESEMELPYSGLHQLCAPVLDHLERLPVPQRDALATVFGLSAGPAPDRFLVGLATLTLFAEVAEQQPLVCIVDDAQWLDDASAQILGFVARRLLAERIALVCAARTGIGDDVLVGLPELSIHGLGDSDARALLLENVHGPLDAAVCEQIMQLSIDGLGDSDARALLLDNLHGPLDAAVCEQIITESHGNPLALLELPRTWNAAELAGGFGLPTSQPVVSKIEESYAKRLLLLPAETQLLVLAAAAEPLGDPVLLHRAAETLGLDDGRGRPRGRRRAAQGRRAAGRVRAPTRPLRRLPLCCGRRPSPCASRPRRSNRPREGPGPARLAPRARDPGIRRGRRRRARTLGRPRTGPRRPGRGRGFSRACGGVDA